MKDYDLNWITAVAEAACLKLSPAVLLALAKAVAAELDELSDLKGYCEIDWQADARDISAFREDRAEAGLEAESLLSAAPCRADVYFAVPEIFSEDGVS